MPDSVLRGLVVDPSGDVQPFVHREGDLAERLRQVVGGYLEGVPLDNETYVYLNEEGKIERLPVNEVATLVVEHYISGFQAAGDFIVGPAVFLGSGPGGTDADLPEESAAIIHQAAAAVAAAADSRLGEPTEFVPQDTPADQADVVVVKGQPYPHRDGLPPGDSFGWHAGQVLLMSFEPAAPDIVANLSSDQVLHVGIAAHGPLAILMLKAPGVGVVESPRPYLVGDVEPDIAVGKGDHILWRLVVVENGIVTGLRAFTTNQRFTVALRRIFAEQRAHGPVTYTEADRAIAAWRASAPDQGTAWRRCLVTCRAGE